MNELEEFIEDNMVEASCCGEYETSRPLSLDQLYQLEGLVNVAIYLAEKELKKTI